MRTQGLECRHVFPTSPGLHAHTHTSFVMILLVTTTTSIQQHRRPLIGSSEIQIISPLTGKNPPPPRPRLAASFSRRSAYFLPITKWMGRYNERRPSLSSREVKLVKPPSSSTRVQRSITEGGWMKGRTRRITAVTANRGRAVLEIMMDSRPLSPQRRC